MMLPIAPIKRHSTSNEVCKVSRVQTDVLYAITQLINLDRELEQDLVPEWRAKYFDYKVRLSKQSGLGIELTMDWPTDWQEEGQGCREGIEKC